MNVKTLNFKKFIEYEKHKSSYMNLPANLVVIIAYCLPGILGLLNINLANFATLSLLVVAIFERKSEMVRFYCLQFCFLSMFFSIGLNLLAIVGMYVPTFQVFNAMLSLIVATFSIFSYFYSLINAVRYRVWVIPLIGTFVCKSILKMNIE